jgi:pSer/pThr/pTyr-binding forkhead associated (FHA) protein
VKIVVDHIRGSRRGQRQELDGRDRLSFGRHPKCDVSFDAHRDLDASSRHAELRRDGERYVLADVGSSNGTFVGGDRVSELDMEVGTPVLVEFGSGGPQLRIWIGTDDMSPAPFRAGGAAPWRWLAIALAIAAVIALGLLWVTR